MDFPSPTSTLADETLIDISDSQTLEGCDMAPRNGPLPKPMNDDAKAARQNFHCDLCNKTYDRYELYTKHTSSYEHGHAQRKHDNDATNANRFASTRRNDSDENMLKPMTLDGPAPGSKRAAPVFKKITEGPSKHIDTEVQDTGDDGRATPPLSAPFLASISTTDLSAISAAHAGSPYTMPPVKPATQKAIDRYHARVEPIQKYGDTFGPPPPIGVIHPCVIATVSRTCPGKIKAGPGVCRCCDTDIVMIMRYDWGFVRDILKAELEEGEYWRPDVEWGQMVEGMTT